MQPVHYDELADLDLNYWWFRVRFNYASRLVLGAVAEPDLSTEVLLGVVSLREITDAGGGTVCKLVMQAVQRPGRRRRTRSEQDGDQVTYRRC